jgi:hypothetical protein
MRRTQPNEPPSGSPRPFGQAGALAAWLAVTGISLAPAALIAARPSDAHAVAAVFPPWWAADRALGAAASAGRLAAVGAVPWVIVVRGDGDVASHLRAAGALLLLDPRAALGCAPLPTDDR